MVTSMGLVRWLLVPLLAGLLSPPAQDGNRAGIVVDFGEETTTACVAFAEPDISSYEALVRSGLALEVNQQGDGAAVCRIEATGCAANDCFCACKGQDCVYWSYWQRVDEAWQYAAIGASQHRVSDGDVDGWVWGPGTVAEAPPPPEVNFDDICGGAGDEPGTEATAVAMLGAPATEGLSTAATVETPATAPTAGPSVWTYGGFVVLLLLLGGLLWLARRRAGGGGA
ncbi:MAG TPA: hypothetical protein PLH39_10885 [Promineifilum sp.]|nr:hypothetical protein [Promineifilum sp.]